MTGLVVMLLCVVAVIAYAFLAPRAVSMVLQLIARIGGVS